MSTLDPADQSLVAGVLARQLRPLAKTITLIESQREDHQARAQQVLEALLPHTGGAMRVGISGVPGVGKSTFIEALGLYLIEQGPGGRDASHPCQHGHRCAPARHQGKRKKSHICL